MLTDCFGEFPSECRGGVVSIGNFDGVHRGHLRLIARLRAAARQRDVAAVAMSFWPPPAQILRPAAAPPILCDVERKRELLLAAGADHALIVETTPKLLQLSAEEFFQHVVLDRLQARALVEGPNFGFGRGRAGNLATLRSLCDRAGIGLEVVSIADAKSVPVSSTTIRAALAEGDVATAAALLGRPHRVSGVVTIGARRGAGLGFPTANLASVNEMFPSDGVYAARAVVADRIYPAAVNIGPNPTFGEKSRKMEAHLVGFFGELYGAAIHLDFLERLRDVRSYSSIEALKTQLTEDVARATSAFDPRPAPIDLVREERARTILEWLRDSIESSAERRPIELLDASLRESGELTIAAANVDASFPIDAHRWLLTVDQELRRVFPEVQSVAWSTAPRSEG